MKTKRLKANNLNHIKATTQASPPTPSASARPHAALTRTLSSSIDPATSKAQRFALLHLLAVRPLPETTIQQRTHVPPEILSKLLFTVADKSGSGSDTVWALARNRFKELDVWSFPYSPHDRELAIENAIHALDNLRLNPRDKLWQLLLPQSERNKGKTLSKLSLFPADHRKILGGIDGKTKSQQGSPNHTRTEIKDEDDMILSDSAPKKTRAPNGSVSKKAAPKTKQPNSPIQSKAPSVNNKKRKPISDELVHSSDDESLPSAPKQRKLEPKTQKETPSEVKKSIETDKKAGQQSNVTAPKNSTGVAKATNTRLTSSAASGKPEAKKRPEKAPPGKLMNSAGKPFTPATDKKLPPTSSVESFKPTVAKETARPSTTKQTQKAAPAGKDRTAASPRPQVSIKRERAASKPSTTAQAAPKNNNTPGASARLSAAQRQAPSASAKPSQDSKSTSAPLKRPAEALTPEASQTSSKPVKRPRLTSQSDSSPLSSTQSSTARQTSTTSNATNVKKSTATHPAKADAPSNPINKPQTKRQEPGKSKPVQAETQSKREATPANNKIKTNDSKVAPKAGVASQSRNTSNKLLTKPLNKHATPNQQVKADSRPQDKVEPSQTNAKPPKQTSPASSNAKDTMSEHPPATPPASEREESRSPSPLSPFFSGVGTPPRVWDPSAERADNGTSSDRESGLQPTDARLAAAFQDGSTPWPEPPLGPDELIDSYRNFYERRAAYNTEYDRAEEKGLLQDDDVGVQVNTEYKRLLSLQQDISASLKAIYNRFMWDSDRAALEILKPVELGGEEVTLHDGDEMASNDEIRARQKTNSEMYLEFTSNVGRMEPDVLKKILEELPELLEEQKKLLRVHVSQFGKEAVHVPIQASTPPYMKPENW